VAGVLEAAQYLAAMKRAGRLRAKRDIVFAAWSGEEIGLLGSTAFVKSRRGLAGGDRINPPIAACLNMDMIGRLRESLVLQGVGSSPVWPREIERRNAPVGLPIRLVDDCFLPTDATPFYMAGVPILSAFTGAHGDYHSPRDTADKVDAKGAARVAKLMALIARGLVMAEEAPAYVEVPFDGSSSRSKAKVALGTMPDYGAEVTGAKLAGVRKGSPAEKAGVKTGDVVVELAGVKVTDLRTYMQALDAMKPGETYSMIVERDGKRVTLSVTPEAK
jgi:Zn-dependent M28 family amino/carboxypeptidase